LVFPLTADLAKPPSFLIKSEQVFLSVISNSPVIQKVILSSGPSITLSKTTFFPLLGVLFLLKLLDLPGVFTGVFDLDFALNDFLVDAFGVFGGFLGDYSILRGVFFFLGEGDFSYSTSILFF